ncbi:hypothetical protein GZ77_25015 [Endozoicomonas montiporae]|uniref:Acetyltransferase n=2 Tax=Endozoicomonas montiporae TaxID=1027273 RepID=A0A081MYV6_9GAMM|nr:hypothetical protein [Endozoicomonas montiporae]AMO54843.1 acetyltransferase [Endozoicomonas montiporae CL-33]KEQ11379.1 hypothetical protein GZ77_25015 [Endozoicomonas montiporae]
MKIVTATESDRTIIFSMLAKAFADDPYVSWLYPDKNLRMSIWPLVMEIIGGKAIGCRTTYMTEDGKAAALWLPPGVQPDLEKKYESIKPALRLPVWKTLKKWTGNISIYDHHHPCGYCQSLPSIRTASNKALALPCWNIRWNKPAIRPGSFSFCHATQETSGFTNVLDLNV